MASVVAPSSWNSKDDRHVYKPFGYTAACWTLFRTKYCVQVKRGPRPWVSEDGETEGVGVNRRSFLASSPSVPILPFFLQKASLIAQGSRCIVFAVPCGCQSGISPIRRSQGSLLWRPGFLLKIGKIRTPAKSPEIHTNNPASNQSHLEACRRRSREFGAISGT